MGREMIEIGKLKKGRFVIVDGEPCRIVNMSSSAPGKHGHAKYKVDAVGLFDGQKRTFVKPSGSRVEIPIIERSTAQVIALMGNSAQLMDLSTYETFELPIPMHLRGELREGVEIEYIQALGRRKIERLKS